MMNINAAEILFGDQPKEEGTTLLIDGNPAPSTAEPKGKEAEEVRVPKTDKEIQQILYCKDEEPPAATLPPGIKELRESDQARKLFGAQEAYRETLPDSILETTADASEFNPQILQAAVHELREIAADVGTSPQEIKLLRERAALVFKNTVDAERQGEAAIEGLNAAFGRGARQALKDARALVARDPRVAQIIDSMGLGNDKETVLALAHAARKQRIAGKLKG